MAKTNNTDFYQEVTNKIIDALEQGVKPWQCPWREDVVVGLPLNFSTQNEYRGMNIMLLWMSTQLNGYSSAQWLTFKQAIANGGKVRKGEKGTRIFFYKMVEKEQDGKKRNTQC